MRRKIRLSCLSLFLFILIIGCASEQPIEKTKKEVFKVNNCGLKSTALREGLRPYAQKPTNDFCAFIRA
jgi:hypothetical protein